MPNIELYTCIQCNNNKQTANYCHYCKTETKSEIFTIPVTEKYIELSDPYVIYCCAKCGFCVTHTSQFYCSACDTPTEIKTIKLFSGKAEITVTVTYTDENPITSNIPKKLKLHNI
jgi:hypothetical protein